MTQENKIKMKPESECLWGTVSLGEVMIRLDSSDMRIKTARSFRVWKVHSM